ncbi:unnamed protein product, partial [Effrenium voratum]
CLTHGNFCAAKSYSSKVTVAARAMKDLLASPGAGRRHEEWTESPVPPGWQPEIWQPGRVPDKADDGETSSFDAGGLAAQALMPWLPTSGQKFGHISRRCARRTPEGHLDWRGGHRRVSSGNEALRYCVEDALELFGPI